MRQIKQINVDKCGYNAQNSNSKLQSETAQISFEKSSGNQERKIWNCHQMQLRNNYVMKLGKMKKSVCYSKLYCYKLLLHLMC